MYTNDSNNHCSLRYLSFSFAPRSQPPPPAPPLPPSLVSPPPSSNLAGSSQVLIFKLDDKARFGIPPPVPSPSPLATVTKLDLVFRLLRPHRRHPAAPSPCYSLHLTLLLRISSIDFSLYVIWCSTATGVYTTTAIDIYLFEGLPFKTFTFFYFLLLLIIPLRKRFDFLANPHFFL